MPMALPSRTLRRTLLPTTLGAALLAGVLSLVAGPLVAQSGAPAAAAPARAQIPSPTPSQAPSPRPSPRPSPTPSSTPSSTPGRLNQVIERFQQGLPSFNNEQWRYIAMEHAPYDIKEVREILRELKPAGATRPRLTPIIRMPPEADDNYKWMVKQVLDVGVMGVILPHVTSKEETLRFIRSMRFPPQKGATHPEPAGVRGWGPTGAVPYWGLDNLSYTLRRADVWPLNPEGELLAIAMIESREGVQNINEILSVPGLGGVLIGPSDLSMDLGVGPNPAAPEVEAMTETVAKACVAWKALCGTFQAPDVNLRIAQGFRIFTGTAGNYTAAPR